MKKWLLCASLTALAGCNVESTDKPTGGVGVVGDELCPAGVVTVLSDYLSTQIALLDKNGEVLSESFVSSGSMEASGVAAPLSGDVVAPSNRSDSGEVVLLDRFGTNVITWVDPASAEVRAQLPVGSGFESNPRDYLELSATKAYVPRWGENAEPSEDDPYSQGGDVLIVDPSIPEISGTIALPRESDQPPRPSSVTLLGRNALVVLQRLALDFASQGDSEIVAVDTDSDEIAWHLVLDGLEGCGRVMLSPSGKRMALGCTGTIDFDGNLIDPAATGIVLLDATTSPPTELRRISVYDQFNFPPQPEIEFVSDDVMLVKTQTPFMGEGNNQLLALDLNDDSFRVLAEAGPNDDGSGRGIVFGSMLCTPSCSDACLVTDLEHSSVRRFTIKGDLAELDAVSLGVDSGLPPVNLGAF